MIFILIFGCIILLIGLSLIAHIECINIAFNNPILIYFGVLIVCSGIAIIISSLRSSPPIV
jgi:hypothetical protein